MHGKVVGLLCRSVPFRKCLAQRCAVGAYPRRSPRALVSCHAEIGSAEYASSQDSMHTKRWQPRPNHAGACKASSSSSSLMSSVPRAHDLFVTHDISEALYLADTITSSLPAPLHIIYRPRPFHRVPERRKKLLNLLLLASRLSFG